MVVVLRFESGDSARWKKIQILHAREIRFSQRSAASQHGLGRIQLLVTEFRLQVQWNLGVRRQRRLDVDRSSRLIIESVRSRRLVNQSRIPATTGQLALQIVSAHIAQYNSSL